MKKKYIVSLLFIGIFLFLSFYIATSYGLWHVTKASLNDNEVENGCFHIFYTDGSDIHLKNLYPTSDEDGKSMMPYTFVVENVCAKDATLSIKLNALKESTMKLSTLKVNVSGDVPLDTTILQNLSEDSSKDENTSVSKVLATTTLKSGNTVRGSLRIWMDQNADYQEEHLTEFIGKIEVTAGTKTLKNEYADATGAARPNLENGMIPVYYDEQSHTWRKADVEEKWYDYAKQEWANAVNVVEAKRNDYFSCAAHTEIAMEDIVAMWVWVPRYEYDFTNLSNSFADKTEEQPGEIKIRFISQSTTVATPNYTIHDAFWWDENEDGKKNENEQLDGFWFAKFELSKDISCNPSNNDYGTGCDLDTIQPMIKPNEYSWRGASVGTYFHTISNQMNSEMGAKYYGLQNSDTHMSKNMEWGAVAYLSQSKYGKYGNTSYIEQEKEIYANPSTTYITGKSSGTIPKKSKSSTIYAYDGRKCAGNTCTTDVTNAKEAYGASTTGTIYGIYDMSGGSYEYVMGMMKTGDTVSIGNSIHNGFNSNFSGMTTEEKEYKGKYTMPSARYYDLYETSEGNTDFTGYHKGDATYETQGWYQQKAEFIYKGATFFVRSGNYKEKSSGIFATYANASGAATSTHTTRAVSIVQIAE